MRIKTIRILRFFLGVFALALLGAYVFWGVRTYGLIADDIQTKNNLILFAVLAIIGVGCSLFLHPLFHETGHILLGKLAGMRLLSFRVWFIEATKKVKGWSFRFIKEGGGKTTMLPIKTKAVRRKTILFAMGGLLGTTVYLCLTALVVFLAPALPVALYAFLGVGAVTATVELFSNIIPSEGSEQTDGEILVSLWKQTPSSRWMLALLCAEGELLAGKRPREVSRDFLFDLPVTQEDDFSFIALLSIRALYALDGGDFSMLLQTYERLEALTEYVSEEAERTIRAEILYFALLRGDRERVARYHTVVAEIEGQSDVASCRVCAAYELYERKNFVAARRYLAAHQKGVEQLVIKGLRVFESDLAQTMRLHLAEQESDN